MHRHECNTHDFLFDLENQTIGFFSYTIFPVKKINVEKVLKLWGNCYLIVLSIHILKLEISGCEKPIHVLQNLRVILLSYSSPSTCSGAWLKANLRVVRPEDIVPSEYMPSVVASILGR
jgi:hypothetical protein